MARGEKGERIEVAVPLAGFADPEVQVHVRAPWRRLACKPADRLTGIDTVPLRDGQRTEVEICRLELTRGQRHRDHQPLPCYTPRVRDHAGRCRAHRLAGRPGDVDAAVLAAAVGRARDKERTDDGAIERPHPLGRSDRRSRHEPEHKRKRKLQQERFGERPNGVERITVGVGSAAGAKSASGHGATLRAQGVRGKAA